MGIGFEFVPETAIAVVHTFESRTAQVQQKTPDPIAERFFMPSLQMGYINHNAAQVSAGLLIQTSLEYRTRKGLLFRINYDDFSGRVSLQTGPGQTYNARIPLTEFIGGLGYRMTRGRHNLFGIMQSGFRFYERPVIENQNGNLHITQKGSIIHPLRCTAGYEYELFDSVFMNLELLAGSFLKGKDYWQTRPLYWGATLGIAARLF